MIREADRLDIEAAQLAVAMATAARARALRRALDNGATTRELALVVGITHSTLWRWAKGAT